MKLIGYLLISMLCIQGLISAEGKIMEAITDRQLKINPVNSLTEDKGSCSSKSSDGDNKG